MPDLGRSRCVPMKVFMPRSGPKSRRGRRSYKAMPKGSVDAQREVRASMVVRKRRESGVTRVRAARGVWACESRPAWCDGGPQERERERHVMLSTAPETR
jgi:hypothetical protein